KTTLSEWRSLMQASLMVAGDAYLTWRGVTDAARPAGMRLFTCLALVTLVLALVLRTLARRLASRLSIDERCLIVGDAGNSALSRRIAAVDGVELIGTISFSELSTSSQDLCDLARTLRVHRLIVAPGPG